MELVLDDVQGAPEGGILSIKIGETRRQAPLSKKGQQFSFNSSLAEPLPMKVEVMVPVAPMKQIMLEPTQQQQTFDVVLGGITLKMSQRAAEDNQRAIPDVGQIVASRKLGDDKKDMASKAAVYLEKHGLVRTLQDMMHGLLVSRPEDPWKYLDEHLARAKALAKETQPESSQRIEATPARLPSNKTTKESIAESSPGGGSTPASPASPTSTSPGKTRGGKGIAKRRGSISSTSKIDALMDILKRTRDNLALIMPYIPEDMQDLLVSGELSEECRQQFNGLDTEKTGKLGPDALRPTIVQLSSAAQQSVTEEQCAKFVSMFDADEDGFIEIDEFTSLTQFVIIAAHLETEDGKNLMKKAQSQEGRFKDFIDILGSDKDRINDIVPFLPEWLVQHLTSDGFLDDCMENFDKLDKDQNNCLSPDEVIPLVLHLCKVDATALNLEKCQQFVDVFDVRKDGVIMRDEFLEFAQFLAVMDFLSSCVEGQQVNEASLYSAEVRETEKLIKALSEDIGNLTTVIQYLPRTMQDELQSSAFEKECRDGFKSLDKNGNNVLDPSELFPLVIDLCKGHPVTVDHEICKRFATTFDKDKNGVISLDEFTVFCQYMIAMGYLEFTHEWRKGEMTHSHTNVEMMLKLMKDHCDRLGEVLPLLPDELQDDLMCESYKAECLEHFDILDKDKSGSLEPRELVPVVIDMCKAHPFALSTDQCNRFVDIFDTEKTGVLSRNEFVNFSRFVCIMSYLETEDGKTVTDIVDEQQFLSENEKKVDFQECDELKIRTENEMKVEDLLRMIETDKNAVHKVIPLLPDVLYECLTGDEFIQTCRQRFMELDSDSNGVLDASELLPVIIDLSEAHPYSVDLQQCQRFVTIFDARGEGFIRIDEFLDFARFIAIQGYLQSDQGKQECAEGLQVMTDVKAIDTLIGMLEQDRHDIKKVIPYLPDDIREELLSESFTLTCLDRFKELDTDCSGSLDPLELYPIISQMTNAHQLALDMDQCQKFTAIFDDGNTGIISKGEFVTFARFLMVMSYLQTEDGQSVRNIAIQAGDISSPDSPTLALQPQLSTTFEAAITSQQKASPLRPDRGPPAEKASSSFAESEGHLSVDLDYYQKKADKLGKENDEQRKRLLNMEEKMRAMEERMETQDRKIRHAAVDLNATPTKK